jgi:hypothetical protein
MPLLVPCVKCQHKLRVKPDLAGKTVRCPNCDSSVQVPAVVSPDAPAAKRNSGPATRSSAAAPRSSHDDRPDDELADVAMISRKLPTPGPLERAFDSVWAVLTARRRELGVGAAIVIALVVLQFGWNFGGGSPSGPQPQVAASHDPVETDAPPAETTEKSSPAATGQSSKRPAAEPAAGAESDPSDATPEPSETRAQLRPRATAPATPQAPQKTPTPSAQRSLPVKPPPNQSSPDTAAEKSNAEKSNTEKPSAETTAEEPAGSERASRKSASHAPVTHKGTYTVENPPQAGEVVIVRLKDGLHLAKVTSVDLSELRCEVTVIESKAYNNGGTIRETKQVDTVRFGQLRIPSRPRSAHPGANGAGGGAM